jgi:hypothetical protein
MIQFSPNGCGKSLHYSLCRGESTNFVEEKVLRRQKVNRWIIFIGKVENLIKTSTYNTGV